MHKPPKQTHSSILNLHVHGGKQTRTNFPEAGTPTEYILPLVKEMTPLPKLEAFTLPAQEVSITGIAK